jgi:V/A-type H+-transporting ATPase subunit A
LVKEGVLQQSALDAVDTFASPEKQFTLLDLILTIHQKGAELVEIGVPVQELTNLPLLARARRLKQIFSSEQIGDLKAFSDEIRAEFDRIRLEYAKFQEHAAT